MSDASKVSVIIPFYSKVHFDLDSPLDCVFNQTYKNLEVVIVDDNSPVSAESCIRKNLFDPRLKVVKNHNNRGGGISRNVGVDNATGDFIAFMDHDDIWYAHKVKKQIDFFIECKNSENKNDDEILVYSQCKIIHENNSIIAPARAMMEGERVSEYIFSNGGLIQTSGLFLHKKLAMKAKFDDLKRHQDYQFCFAVEEQNAQFLMIGEPLYEFIQHPKKNDYAFSLWWLLEYGRFFDEVSALNFKKKVIIRSMIFHHGHIVKAINYAMENGIKAYTIKCILIHPIRKFFRKIN